MKSRRWMFFIGLNIVVSLLTTLGVLALKGDLERVVVVTATSSIGPVAEIPTAIPVSVTPGLPVNPTTSAPFEYVIQSGDTLGGVAFAFDIPLQDLLLANNLVENSIIQPGQLLLIPLGDVVTPTPVTPSPIPELPTPATATSFPTETPTPPGPVQVRIQEVLSPGELGREGVVIVNRGRTVNLRGWTLGVTGADLVYVFPRLTLAQEVPVTVYTITGDDSPQALHWGLNGAQWGATDTIIKLRDADGDLIATYAVP